MLSFETWNPWASPFRELYRIIRTVQAEIYICQLSILVNFS